MTRPFFMWALIYTSFLPARFVKYHKNLLDSDDYYTMVNRQILCTYYYGLQIPNCAGNHLAHLALAEVKGMG